MASGDVSITARSVSFACRTASSDRFRSVISREFRTYPRLSIPCSNRLPMDSSTRQTPARWRVRTELLCCAGILGAFFKDCSDTVSGLQDESILKGSPVNSPCGEPRTARRTGCHNAPCRRFQNRNDVERVLDQRTEIFFTSLERLYRPLAFRRITHRAHQQLPGDGAFNQIILGTFPNSSNAPAPRRPSRSTRR